MDQISHRTIEVNGIRMHIAEKGQGEGRPVVLLLHGFPDLWYSWRHQITALSALGFHTVAPDLRGYGDSDCPPSVSSYTYYHLVGDLVALINHLGVDQILLVAHDWGAMVGWQLCLFRPDKVKAFVCLSVPFRPRNPTNKPIASLRRAFGENYYICRFQAPGAMEAEIEHIGAAKFLAITLTTRSPKPPILPQGNPSNLSEEKPIELPSWLTQEDIEFYASKFTKSGFTGALSYYRAMDLNWELTAAWDGAKVKVPVKFVAGDLDMVFAMPGMKEFVNGPLFKEMVPLLDEVVVMEGVAHFINQEKPDEISSHIYDYFKNFV